MATKGQKFRKYTETEKEEILQKYSLDSWIDKLLMED